MPDAMLDAGPEDNDSLEGVPDPPDKGFEAEKEEEEFVPDPPDKG